MVLISVTSSMFKSVIWSLIVNENQLFESMLSNSTKFLSKFKVHDGFQIFIQNSLRHGPSGNNESCFKSSNLPPRKFVKNGKILNGHWTEFSPRPKFQRTGSRGPRQAERTLQPTPSGTARHDWDVVTALTGDSLAA
jgi:hypothetical protein